jgi:hypothetical protein
MRIVCMGHSALVVALWMQVQVSRSVCVVSSKDDLIAESCIVRDTVANEEPSLLQTARQTSRLPSAPDGLRSGQDRKRVMQLSPYDVLLYNHMPKAGGSFIRTTLEDTAKKVIPPNNLRIVMEAQGLTEDDRRHTFIIGSVRNPCDYYVSEWAFHHRMQWPGYPKEYYGVSEDLNTTEDQRRFGEWLRWLTPDAKPPGLLTAIMLESYFTESVVNVSRKLSIMHGEGNTRYPEADRRTYLAAAASFGPDSAVDCWVKTENLTSDFRRCLTLFDQQAGNIVDWTAFNDLIASREQQLQQQRMDWRTKNSGHQKCNFYFDYGGDRLKDYVYKTDPAVFEKFGYESCCSSDNA